MLEIWGRVFGYGGNLSLQLVIILLVMARLIGILMLVPFMGGKAVPTQVKVATAGALALIIVPVIQGTLTVNLPDLGPGLALYMMKEVFVGVTIGYVAALTFNAFEAAGQFLDTARGATMATLFIPQLEESGPLFAALKVQLAIVLFLIFGGHRIFLRAVFGSFILLPVDKFPSLGGNSMAFVDLIIRSSANVLLIGMQIVIPALIAIFLVDVVLGVANRAAPQLNVFFLGMPIKAYLGIVFVLLSLNYIVGIMGKQFALMLRDVNVVIQMMKG
jgi:flagellar biosynthetic protein FliR